ncbi:MAG: alpha/beta hydrolase [Phycisphaerales bacterium]|nr:alpha/beta hydrolase [Phycisphaerales bacterium]
MPTIRVRRYGTSGPLIALLHGGPGAPGYLAPVARRLAEDFQVLEPFQRGAGDERLTVSHHVTDLHELLQPHGGDSRPAIVGHSWGAMLALAYGALHSDSIGAIVLVSCGTFDPASRERMTDIREQRMGDTLKGRAARIMERYPTNPDARLKAMGRLYQVIDSVKLIPHKDETDAFDARAHQESWEDMVRLQEEGRYPAEFSAIRTPVLMLHGSADPHPGQMIRGVLAPHLPQLEYHEWERCGHYPWLEEAVHQSFYEVLRDWLTRQYG